MQHMNISAAELIDFGGIGFDRGRDTFIPEDDFDIVDSKLKFELYHFKVMQLRTYEDTAGASECKVRF